MAPGRKKVVETPEFEAAVAAQVQEQVSIAMDKLKADMLAAAAPGLAPPVPGGVPVTGTAIDLLSDVLSKLSMNMAAIGRSASLWRPKCPSTTRSWSSRTVILAQRRSRSWAPSLARQGSTARREWLSWASRLNYRQALVGPIRLISPGISLMA